MTAMSEGEMAQESHSTPSAMVLHRAATSLWRFRPSVLRDSSKVGGSKFWKSCEKSSNDSISPSIMMDAQLGFDLPEVVKGVVAVVLIGGTVLGAVLLSVVVVGVVGVVVVVPAVVAVAGVLAADWVFLVLMMLTGMASSGSA